MGSFKRYVATGGFSQYLYYQVGDTITAENGIQGKVVDKIDSSDNIKFHDSLPIYSNTSNVYFKRSDEGNNPIEQARIYTDRKATLDFDWGHTHGEHPKDVVHVHEWHFDKNGHWIRNANPRFMNNEEIANYGDLIKKANPNVRLRYSHKRS